jgi:hypothetical protein
MNFNLEKKKFEHSFLFTAYARLHLYDSALRVLDYRCLYLDTDSVLFLDHPDFPTIPLGNHFGDYTDQTDGRKIVKWCSNGPKCYVYVFEDGKSVVKMKGISAKYSQEVDYDTLRSLTLGRLEGLEAFHDRSDQAELLHSVAKKRDNPCLVFPQFRLERSLKGCIWQRSDFTKTISFKFVKRCLLMPTEEEKAKTMKTNSSPIVQMADMIARCERSFPWGFGDSHMNDERMSYYRYPKSYYDYSSDDDLPLLVD